jgi:ABC-type branched-subunit amino acid transport system ATPase component/ABC-type branched-subunit amino acid transport system permease subunit
MSADRKRTVWPRNLGYVAAALGILLIPGIANDFYIHLAQTLFYTAIAVIGLNILLGLSGQMSLGQAGFYAIGAYGSALLSAQLRMPLAVSMVAGVLFAGFAGLLVGLVALRARGLYLAMATLAFGFIVEIAAQRWTDLTGGTMGIFGIPSLDFGSRSMGKNYFLWVAGALYLGAQLVSDYVFASRYRRNLLALKENESSAQTAGINVPVWRTAVFAASALAAGMAGVLFTHQSAYINSDAFTLNLTLTLLIATVIGGLGFSYGPILGTLITLLIAEIIASFYDVSFLIYGVILLTVLLLFPQGAIGLLQKIAGFSRIGSVRETPPPGERFSGASVAPREGRVARGTEPALLIEGLTKRYAGVTALKNVSVRIERGTVHALIGPNGAGKSTLINVVSGLYAADDGRIVLDGSNITHLPSHARARLGLARTFQNLQLVPSLSALENVMIGIRRERGVAADFSAWMTRAHFDQVERGRALMLLDQFGIAHVSDARPDDLPYGHRKLVELARAIAEEPTTMLLDEPIAGLNDEEARQIANVIRRIRNDGTTILLGEHKMDFVMSLSDRVTVLDYGEGIAEGTPDEVRSNPRVVTAYLGVGLDAEQDMLAVAT